MTHSNNLINKNKFKLLISLVILISFSGCASSMYDEDFDGVVNNKDVCLGTPKTVKVDKYGCALDSDHDGVLDIYDRCPNTPFADMVNSIGCTK